MPEVFAPTTTLVAPLVQELHIQGFRIAPATLTEVLRLAG